MRTILAFGDSNTHGTRAMRHWGDRRRHAPADRWPTAAAAALGAEWEMVAEGHPGRTAVFDDPVEGTHKNGLRALPVLLETHRPIDLVIVMLGTNDTKARFGLSPHDIALGLDRVVTAIRASDAGPRSAPPRVLLAAPVPVEEAGILAPVFAGGAERSRALAPLLQEVAQRHRAGFLDLAQVARADPVDGVHLSAGAHAAIAAAMAAEVRRLFPG